MAAAKPRHTAASAPGCTLGTRSTFFPSLLLPRRAPVMELPRPDLAWPRPLPPGPLNRPTTVPTTWPAFLPPNPISCKPAGVGEERDGAGAGACGREEEQCGWWDPPRAARVRAACFQNGHRNEVFAFVQSDSRKK
jgi:hypothetical protein